MNVNIVSLANEIAKQFKHIYKHPDEQQQTAWWLLEGLTVKKKAQLLAQQELELSKDEEKTLNKLVTEHRIDVKPLQYIIGFVPFVDLKILVEPPVLIPRPETEEWCINVINQLQKLQNKKNYILDLATGSGCIALALAKAFPESRIMGTDISEAALELAKKNAKHNHLHNVEFLKSDLYTSIPHDYKFDLIVSNPPYIDPTEWEALSPMVRKWEDKKALVAKQKGLEFIEEIIQQAPTYLKQNAEFKALHIPQLIIEIGHQQGPAVKKLMQEAGFTQVSIEKDLAGKDRVVTGGLW